MDFSQLEPKYQSLLLGAKEAMGKAYAPYSNFYVGAALLSQDGKIIQGANFENASFGLTICAERSAVFNANVQGHRMFEAFAVIARHRDFDTKSITGPCGACRQVLYEARQLSGRDLVGVFATSKLDTIEIISLDELLPKSFGPSDLGVGLDDWRSFRQDSRA